MPNEYSKNNRGSAVALKKCNECSREISTSAITCPGCGAYLHRKTVRLVLLVFFGPIIALFVGLLGVAVWYGIAG
jgi:hypothetical protein